MSTQQERGVAKLKAMVAEALSGNLPSSEDRRRDDGPPSEDRRRDARQRIHCFTGDPPSDRAELEDALFVLKSLESVEGPWTFDESAPTIEDMISEIFKDVTEEEWDRIPQDLTDRLDHYIHGGSI